MSLQRHSFFQQISRKFLCISCLHEPHSHTLEKLSISEKKSKSGHCLWIFIRTSSSRGAGVATSRNCRTSGGPYFVYTIAFIRRVPRLILSALSNHPEPFHDGLHYCQLVWQHPGHGECRYSSRIIAGIKHHADQKQGRHQQKIHPREQRRLLSHDEKNVEHKHGEEGGVAKKRVKKKSRCVGCRREQEQ